MTTNEPPAEGARLVYQVNLPLSTKTLSLVVTAIRGYRSTVKSRWRKLPDGQAAHIVLAVLRHDQRPADLASAYGISRHTVHRWVRQAITMLARQAPRLDRVLARAARHEVPVLLLDGCCLPTHRPTHNSRRRRCPKHKAYHLRVLTLTDQHGRLLWVSAATGAGLHETTQAKRHHLPRRLRALTPHIALICDRAHTRLDDQPEHPTVITGRRACRNHKLTPAEITANQLVAAERATNEHAHAHLKNWRILHRLRHGWPTTNTTTLLRALLVLTTTEINR